MRRFWAGVLAFCMLLVLSACGGDTHGTVDEAEAQQDDGQAADAAPQPKSPVEGRSVALIPGALGDPFYEAANAGAQRYAAQWGLEIRYMGEAGASADAQAEAIRGAIEQGLDGICISAINAEEVSAALREASAAGLCVTTWDHDTAPDARSLMVSQGTASVMGSMLVEMGAASLRERTVDVGGEVRYLWCGAGEENAGEAAWYAAARSYIRQNYPNWVELGEPYLSGQDAEQSGEALLDAYGADVDLILCDSAAVLTGQCRAAQNRGLSAENVTITGFCTPSEMLEYLNNGICTRWGLWDCGMQSAMGCYLAAWLAQGNMLRVGDVVNIPDIGNVEILANSELDSEQTTAEVNNGVVLLPERIVFTADTIGDYYF